MKIIVRDKTFNIELVNNYSHQLYDEIAKKTRALVDNADELEDRKDEFTEEINQAGTIKEKKKIRKEFKDYLKEGEKNRDALKTEIVELRLSYIKEILITNDIEFDDQWWIHKTQPNDMNEFLIKCVNKDVIEGKKSGKK